MGVGREHPGKGEAREGLRSQSTWRRTGTTRQDPPAIQEARRAAIRRGRRAGKSFGKAPRFRVANC